LIEPVEGAMPLVRRYCLTPLQGPAVVSPDVPMYDSLDDLEAAIIGLEDQSRASEQGTAHP
jgi:hypothetical protein